MSQEKKEKGNEVEDIVALTQRALIDDGAEIVSPFFTLNKQL